MLKFAMSYYCPVISGYSVFHFLAYPLLVY